MNYIFWLKVVLVFNTQTVLLLKIGSNTYKSDKDFWLDLLIPFRFLWKMIK